MAKIHDSLFRGFLADIRVAKEFCAQFLPEHIQKQLRLETLQACNTSFIEADLREIISDIVFSVEFQELAGYIYVLIEHQSSSDRWLPLRILRYTLALMDQHVKNTGEKFLPMVYPLIFYNGERTPYPEEIGIAGLFSEENKIKFTEMVLNGFQLIDLGQIADQKLRENTWSGVLAYVMKNRHQENILKFWRDILPDLQALAAADAHHLLHFIVEYTILSIKETQSVSTAQMVQFFYEISKNVGEDAMTFADRLREEGMEKGIEKGMEKGIQKGIEKGIEKGRQETKYAILSKMLKNNFDMCQIEKITKLPPHEIKRIASEIGKM